MALISQKVEYETGQVLHVEQQHLSEVFFQYDWCPEDFEIYNALPQEEKACIRQDFEKERERLKDGIEVTKQMPEYYKKMISAYIEDFKETNPALNDGVPSADSTTSAQTEDLKNPKTSLGERVKAFLSKQFYISAPLTPPAMTAKDKDAARVMQVPCHMEDRMAAAKTEADRRNVNNDRSSHIPKGQER